MVYNVCKVKSYTATVATDECTILNMAGKASLLKIEGADVKKIKEFDVLKNPSYGAIASDMKVLAYKNTSGKIAVHDTETGELILKHSAVKCEGWRLYFIQQNKRILSSTWDSDIYMIDISKGEIIKKSRIGEGEFFGASILPGKTEDDYFVYCTQRNDHWNTRIVSSTIFKLSVNVNGFDYEPICNIPVCNTSTPAKFHNSLLFSSDSNTHSKLYMFDTVSDTLHEYMDIQQVCTFFNGAMSNELQRVTYIHGTTDGKYLIVVCNWETVLIIEVSCKICIKKLEHKYISNVLLFNRERYLWIGTWEKTYIYDFLELVDGV